MERKIDRSYQVEKLLEWERKSWKEQNSIFIFSDKNTWLITGRFVLFILGFSFIAPFIPSKHNKENWIPPTTIEEYQLGLSKNLVFSSIMIVLILFFNSIRLNIDLFLGVKQTANFEISKIYTVGAIKILRMNRWRIFTIKIREPYFETISVGQIITLKRTGTFKLISYYIRDKKKFNSEK